MCMSTSPSSVLQLPAPARCAVFFALTSRIQNDFPPPAVCDAAAVFTTAWHATCSTLVKNTSASSSSLRILPTSVAVLLMELESGSDRSSRWRR
eukprot:CAMPEP_0178982278 /NCGR_PEP_ID=MMETSP0795-20121207/410_1 /TAXON_ID=88552 /ORGANISM="Amoebophrya sp., Strain Ameob2" /LENGTH=93 /DNA_ID=CAMNT_0020672911 /DNA_START=348 /DNA_END=629 /DNA_ORIENTATION=-